MLAAIGRCRGARSSPQVFYVKCVAVNSSVSTANPRRGEQIARRLKAGIACVNDAVLSGLALELAFGATGGSGRGARHGAEGIRKCCTTQSLLINRIASPELQLFPAAPDTRATSSD